MPEELREELRSYFSRIVPRLIESHLATDRNASTSHASIALKRAVSRGIWNTPRIREWVFTPNRCWVEEWMSIHDVPLQSIPRRPISLFEFGLRALKDTWEANRVSESLLDSYRRQEAMLRGRDRSRVDRSCLKRLVGQIRAIPPHIDVWNAVSYRWLHRVFVVHIESRIREDTGSLVDAEHRPVRTGSVVSHTEKRWRYILRVSNAHTRFYSDVAAFRAGCEDGVANEWSCDDLGAFTLVSDDPEDLHNSGCRNLPKQRRERWEGLQQKRVGQERRDTDPNTNPRLAREDTPLPERRHAPTHTLNPGESRTRPSVESRTGPSHSTGNRTAPKRRKLQCVFPTSWGLEKRRFI